MSRLSRLGKGTAHRLVARMALMLPVTLLREDGQCAEVLQLSLQPQARVLDLREQLLQQHFFASTPAKISDLTYRGFSLSEQQQLQLFSAASTSSTPRFAATYVEKMAVQLQENSGETHTVYAAASDQLMTLRRLASEALG